jgi:hypothetical protein
MAVPGEYRNVILPLLILGGSAVYVAIMRRAMGLSSAVQSVLLLSEPLIALNTLIVVLDCRSLNLMRFIPSLVLRRVALSALALLTVGLVVTRGCSQPTGGKIAYIVLCVVLLPALLTDNALYRCRACEAEADKSIRKRPYLIVFGILLALIVPACMMGMYYYAASVLVCLVAMGYAALRVHKSHSTPDTCSRLGA